MYGKNRPKWNKTSGKREKGQKTAENSRKVVYRAKIDQNGTKVDVIAASGEENWWKERIGKHGQKRAKSVASQTWKTAEKRVEKREEKQEENKCAFSN